MGIATSQFFMGAWQQAGNVLRVMPARPWLCEMRERWEGTPYEAMALKELQQENGEEWPYGDRMQEVVFIGKDLNHELIQTLLDNCLLTDQEMEMGPRMWQESWYDTEDKIRLPTKLFLDHNVLEVETLNLQDDSDDDTDDDDNDDRDNDADDDDDYNANDDQYEQVSNSTFYVHTL